MQIIRYTPEVQKQLGSKTKPEPWLHVVVVKNDLLLDWAIYVWDTRQVVEEGSDYRSIPNDAPKAVDNRKMLKGAKNANITAAFDKRYFIVDRFGTMPNMQKIIKVFNDKKAADAWYAQYRKDTDDINKQILKIVADAQSKYAKSNKDYKPGRGIVPQELMKLEDGMKSKFYDKQPEYHRLGHRIDVRSAKWLAQNAPKLYTVK